MRNIVILRRKFSKNYKRYSNILSFMQIYETTKWKNLEKKLKLCSQSSWSSSILKLALQNLIFENFSLIPWSCAIFCKFHKIFTLEGALGHDGHQGAVPESSVVHAEFGHHFVQGPEVGVGRVVQGPRIGTGLWKIRGKFAKYREKISKARKIRENFANARKMILPKKRGVKIEQNFGEKI